MHFALFCNQHIAKLRKCYPYVESECYSFTKRQPVFSLGNGRLSYSGFTAVTFLKGLSFSCEWVFLRVRSCCSSCQKCLPFLSEGMSFSVLLSVMLAANGELLTSVCTTWCKYATAVLSWHALAEAVLVYATAVVWLECSFHFVLRYLIFLLWLLCDTVASSVLKWCFHVVVPLLSFRHCAQFEVQSYSFLLNYARKVANLVLETAKIMVWVGILEIFLLILHWYTCV